jgi:imidazolonepropionase-like amidohydrolase
VLVIREGKILALGRDGEVEVPEGAVRHELPGKVLMPGLICTHSHCGQPSGGDSSGPIQPGVRVLDAINVRHPSIQKAQAGGITTANVMPGSGHLLSGQTVYLKFRDGDTIEELALRDEEGGFLGGMKMANGTNSRRDPPFPGSRAKSAALMREKLLAAEEYGRKLEAGAGGDGEDGGKEPPPRDLAMEGLLEVLEGKRVVHHHTHRHDDILTVLRLAEEFGFRVVLHHVSDAALVADEIAAAGVPCSIIVVDSPGGKIEAKDIALENGAALEAAGVLVAFHTDDPITDSRLFLRSAGLAVRAGMSRQKALEGLTIAGAKILDLEDRIGSLAPGKDADFLVLSGDPLSVYTHVEQTFVDGVEVFDRADERDHLYAVGGPGAGDDRGFTGCCLLEGDPE